MLISTDLLARGFDNRHIGLVVNLDIPKVYNQDLPDYETYIHRIGRTGRYGDRGVALNVVDDEADLERLIKIQEKYRFKMIEIKNVD